MAEKRFSPQQMGFFFSLAQVGLEMVIPIALGVAVDLWLPTAPWGILLGVVLGFAGGMFHLISLVNRQEKIDSSKEEQDSQ